MNNTSVGISYEWVEEIPDEIRAYSGRTHRWDLLRLQLERLEISGKGLRVVCPSKREAMLAQTATKNYSLDRGFTPKDSARIRAFVAPMDKNDKEGAWAVWIEMVENSASRTGQA